MAPDNDPKSPDWRQHLQIVFSVLVGVSLAQAFKIAAIPPKQGYRFFLLATVFYVVLDCWYNLNFELIYFRRSKWWDVALYFLTLISYSCIPFLYFAQTATTTLSHGSGIHDLRPPEILMLNLAAICFFDALRRNVGIVRKRHEMEREPTKVEALDDDASKHFEQDSYFIITGYGWFIVIGFIAYVFNREGLDITWCAAGVLALWLLVRTTDHFIVKSIPQIVRATASIIEPPQRRTVAAPDAPSKSNDPGDDDSNDTPGRGV